VPDSPTQTFTKDTICNTCGGPLSSPMHPNNSGIITCKLLAHPNANRGPGPWSSSAACKDMERLQLCSVNADGSYKAPSRSPTMALPMKWLQWHALVARKFPEEKTPNGLYLPVPYSDPTALPHSDISNRHLRCHNILIQTPDSILSVFSLSS
jgi:hypothetical protein